MESVLKLPASQSLFNANNNLVDVVIPGSSGVYDLSQSFVSVLTRLTPAVSAVALIAGTGADNGVYDVRVHFKHHVGAHDSIYDTTATPIECMVSSCSMISASRGTVEDIRACATLRGSLSVYKKDLDSRQAEALTTWAGAAKDQPWSHGQHVDLRPVGTLVSREITHEIRLPLADLMDAGQFTAWDSSVYGDTRIHLELNLGQIITTQCLGPADPTWDAAYQQRTLANGTTADIPAYGYATGPQGQTVANGAAGAGGSQSLTSLIMVTPYDSLEDSPWWVGQDVLISVTNIGGQTAGCVMTKPVAETIDPAGVGAEARAIIRAIAYNKTTGIITLTFGGPVVVSGDNSGTNHGGTLNVKVRGSGTAGTVAGAAAPIIYESVDLVATQRTDIAQGAAPQEHQFSRFTNQADVFSNTSQMQRTYQLPANCSAVVVAVTNNAINHSSYLGSAKIDDYRFTIDGEQVTNRAVPYAEQGGGGTFRQSHGSSLHYDLLGKTFLNMGPNGRYESMMESVYDQLIPVGQPGDAGTGQGWSAPGLDPRKPVFLIGTPVPMKQDTSQLLIELNGNFTGGASLQIYSYVVDTI